MQNCPRQLAIIYIYINDLFFINDNTDVCNYADDTTFYKCDKDINNLMKSLEHDSLLAIEWFDSNYMKLNENKCHFTMAGHKHEHIWAKIGQTMIWEQKNVKLLGVHIDSKLSFNDHVTSLCVKAGRKHSCKIAQFLKDNKIAPIKIHNGGNEAHAQDSNAYNFC